MRQVAVFVLASLALASVSSAQTPTQVPADPVRVGGVIRAPKKITNVAPIYPAIAMQAGKEGTVILELLISPVGIVESAKVIRSVALLDQAALNAVYQWEYEPTYLNGVAVPIYYNITVSFSLADARNNDQATAATPAGGTTNSPAAAAVQPSADADVTRAALSAVRVGGNIKAPAKLNHVAPVYPEIARQAGATGTVILELLIGTTGSVEAAKVIRSVPLLDQAAVDAARQWTYEPTLLNGAPVPVFYNVTVTFSGQ